MERYQYSPVEKALMENARVPFAVYQLIDRRVVTLALSAGFCQLYGFEDRAEAYDVMDHDMYRDAHPDDAARIADAAFRFATEGGQYNVVYRTRVRGEYRVVHAMGEHFYTETGVRLAQVWYTDEGPYRPETGADETGLSHSLNRDMSERSQYQSMNYNYLTGLPTMTYFFELAEAGRESIRKAGGQPAVVFIDLIGMRNFNRKHGFAEGDKLIRAVARVLVKYFSNENCSHFGQDHFAVFTEAEGLEQKLQGIFRECDGFGEGKKLPVRAGIYVDNIGHVDIGTACDRAKAACNVTRKAYISHFRYFDETMLADAETQQYIIDNLDRAIREGWIQVYYQPIVRAANGRVCEEEALARWIDPERGILHPSDFVPVLEDAKLAEKLDLYVTDQVLEKLKKQAEAGLFIVPQSVNLSRADFDTCDIVEEIRRRVDVAGIPRDQLTIEITESIIGQDFDFMKEQITRFQKLGFHVWMDDFGSGYSSLDLLQTIHFDLIKFDMRFMQQFDQTDKSKIILTELIKMAIGLGIDTVAEGVERQDQVDFLRDVGCTKIQGYYFCEPIPLEKIMERYQKGIQIGFENPLESDYFASLGRINLYDLSVAANEDPESFRRYFDTLPMAIFESNEQGLSLIRCNQSYRDFMKRIFAEVQYGKYVPFGAIEKGESSSFLNAVRQCREDGKRIFIDERLENGSIIHSFVRRIAVNPVTGIVACVAVVLAITDARQDESVTFSHIAQALSSDYFNLYYVDLDTEQFVEYSPDLTGGSLAVERHGEDFFSASRRDALSRIYEEDRAMFIDDFSKENVIRSMDTNGTFTLTYRLLLDGSPIYVNMKATRIKSGGNHIIIGVSNVDQQMRHQEALERMKAEQITYSRIAALNGDYIAIYTIDPKTDHYVEYSATPDYEGLGLAKEGDDFFAQARTLARRTLYLEDMDMFISMLTKENVMKAIGRTGLFSMNYRLMMDGEPRHVCLKAALVQEKCGPQLIIGVNNIDDQVKREQEYAHKLSMARNLANIDELTGIKNKHAYVDVEAQLNHMIEEGQAPKFAVVVCDLNGLKTVNDTQGHQAGDHYLKAASAAICDIFKHSPVFRVGGDEFAVIAQGHDYEDMPALVERLRENSEKNTVAGGVVIACGMSRYQGDRCVADVFSRADDLMYENKKELKRLAGKPS